LAVELDTILVLQPSHLIFGGEVERPKASQEKYCGDHEAD
jgi:hypothetical protein